MADANREAHAAAFRAIAAHRSEHGLRDTVQRRQIVEVVLQAPAHATLEELIARTRALHPRVGATTVHRTVALLVACGVLVKRRFGDHCARYELARPIAHDHLLCRGCGRVEECPPALAADSAERARTLGFTVVAHECVLYGYCAACAPPPDGAGDP